MIYSFYLCVIFALLWMVTKFRFNGVFLFSSIYIAFYYLGIPWYFLENYVNSDIQSILIGAASWYILAFLLGALWAARLLSKDISNTIYTSLIRFPRTLTVTQKYRVWVVIVAGFIVGSYYFRFGIPYFSTFPDLARFNAVSGATPFFFLLTYLTPMYLFILAESWGKVGQWVSFSLMLIMTFLTAFRSAPAKLLLARFIAKEKYNNPKVINKVVFLSAFLMLFIIVTSLKFGHLTAGEVVASSLDRLFLVNIKNALFVIETFNYETEFLSGQALIMDMANYIPKGGDTFGVWVNQQVFGYQDVSANPSFTVVWADIGWLMVIPMFFLGVLTQLLDDVDKYNTLNAGEKIIWTFFVLTLGFSCTNPYAKNLYFTLPMVVYLLSTRYFVLVRFK